MPADLLTYAEIDGETGWATVVAHPADALGPAERDRYTALLALHPLVERCRAAPDRRPGRLSDLADRLGDAPHADALRPLGLGFELGLLLPWRGAMSAGVLIARSGADFDGREVELAGLTAPPLIRTAMRLRRRAVAAELLRGAEVPEDLLSRREREVLGHVAQGQTNARIARALGVSPRTVDKHLENIYRKLDVTGRVAAVRHLLGGRVPPAPAPRTPGRDEEIAAALG